MQTQHTDFYYFVINFLMMNDLKIVSVLLKEKEFSLFPVAKVAIKATTSKKIKIKNK